MSKLILILLTVLTLSASQTECEYYLNQYNHYKSSAEYSNTTEAAEMYNDIASKFYSQYKECKKNEGNYQGYRPNPNQIRR